MLISGYSFGQMLFLKNTKVLYITFAIVSLLMVAAPATVSAAECNDNTPIPSDVVNEHGEDEFCANKGGFSYKVDAGCIDDNNDRVLDKTECGIFDFVFKLIRALSAIVGIVVVIMITVAGIQYAASGPDPSAVVAAKKRIVNALIALALYIFMFAFLQWLVPGGII